ncbi:MAG: caspase family protein, partial [Rhodobacterales bacterium]
MSLPLRIALNFKAFIVIFLLAGPVLADDRIALVIGNGDYIHVPKLQNSVNDARKISDTLVGIGFDVTTLLDAPRDEIIDAMADFSFRSEVADL